MKISLKKTKIAIRVDGNQFIGLGHIFRCFYLAKYIKEYGGIPYFFILKSSINPLVVDLISKENFDYYIVSHHDNPWKENIHLFKTIIQKESFHSVLIDLLIPDASDNDLFVQDVYIPSDITNLIKELSSLKIPIFAFSDQFDQINFRCDLIINTCPTQKYEWYNCSEKYLLGPKYYIVGQPFHKLISNPKKFRTKDKRIVIFCGGNDHRGFTNIIIDTMQNLIADFEVEIIVGASTPLCHNLIENIQNKKIKIHCKPINIAQILFDADAVISTSGNTLFDLAAIGIPAAALSTRERQRITANFFHEKGSCIDVGSNIEEIKSGLINFFNMMLHNDEKLQQMRQRGKQLIDGNGAIRIIKEMSNRL